MLASVFLLLGSFWIVVNIFFLPFHPWTEGYYRSWLILKGLVPYKDFLWVREPLDITFLAWINKLFGLNILNYQMVMFFLFLLISLVLFFFLKKKSLTLALTSYTCYVVFLFPLFLNAEIEEVLVGLFSLLVFFSLWEYTQKRQTWLLWAAGICSGLAMMTKLTSAVIVIISWLYLVLTLKQKTKQAVFYLLGVTIPLLIVALCLANRGALDDFLADLYFVVTLYRKWMKPWGIKDGLMMAGLYLAALVPAVLLHAEKLIAKQIRNLLAMFILGLLVMLLASYWSYRLVASFPLLSIVLGVLVLEGYHLLRGDKRITEKIILVGSLVVFSFLFSRFGQEYLQFIRDNGFAPKQYLFDYGENELKTATWLRDNTSPNEKIFNMSNNIIMVEADRLPDNRYVGGMPCDYLPFEKTAQELSAKPPKVVVLQQTLLDGWPELLNWKFIDFLKKQYVLQEQFGDIGIYFLNEKRS